MCCDFIFVILVCQHIGAMVKEKGHNPLPYQIFMAVGWIGGEIIGGALGLFLAIVLNVEDGDVVGLCIAAGVLLGLACGAGPVYLLAANLAKDPNYRPPQPAPGSSPYGPSPYGPTPGAASYAPPPQNPFANNPVPQQQFPQSFPPTSPGGSSPTGPAAAPGIPSFLPASAFAPAPSAPRRVQFYCPSGHLLEEWSTAAGEQRRCPHCGGISAVPVTG